MCARAVGGVEAPLRVIVRLRARRAACRALSRTQPKRTPVFSSRHLQSLCDGREKPPLALLSLALSSAHLPSAAMLLLYNCFLSLLESIYRRGARRWRKLYRVNGHLFQAKRFNRVSVLSPRHAEH